MKLAELTEAEKSIISYMQCKSVENQIQIIIQIVDDHEEQVRKETWEIMKNKCVHGYLTHGYKNGCDENEGGTCTFTTCPLMKVKGWAISVPKRTKGGKV